MVKLIFCVNVETALISFYDCMMSWSETRTLDRVAKLFSYQRLMR